jgi:hypothetical protein
MTEVRALFRSEHRKQIAMHPRTEKIPAAGGDIRGLQILWAQYSPKPKGQPVAEYREQRLAMVSEIIDREVESFKDLTHAELVALRQAISDMMQSGTEWQIAGAPDYGDPIDWEVNHE